MCGFTPCPPKKKASRQLFQKHIYAEFMTKKNNHFFSPSRKFVFLLTSKKSLRGQGGAGGVVSGLHIGQSKSRWDSHVTRHADSPPLGTWRRLTCAFLQWAIRAPFSSWQQSANRGTFRAGPVAHVEMTSHACTFVWMKRKHWCGEDVYPARYP